MACYNDISIISASIMDKMFSKYHDIYEKFEIFFYLQTMVRFAELWSLALRIFPTLYFLAGYYYYLFEQKYRSHIMITCLYHNMQKTYTQLNDIYIYMMINTMIIDMMLHITRARPHFGGWARMHPQYDRWALGRKLIYETKCADWHMSIHCIPGHSVCKLESCTYILVGPCRSASRRILHNY